MKKKIAIVIFTLVCTIGITASIASFSLGLNGRLMADSSGENLKEIYQSYVSQIERIIKMSHMNPATDPGADPVYHVVQIVDNKAATDDNDQVISEFLANYVDKENDSDSVTEGNFRTGIIDKDQKEKMKPQKIEVKTYEASSDSLAEAVGKADLIYIACNTGYTKNSDLEIGAFSTNVVTALEKYALAQGKPVLIDSQIVGIADKTGTHTSTEDTKAAQYLYNTVKTSMNQGTSKGVYSEKDPNQSWTNFFDKDQLYIAFDNRGSFPWNKFDYAGGYQHKVLEVVLDADTVPTTPTPFESMLATDEFKHAFVYANKVVFDDYDTTTHEATNLKYKAVTVSDLNAMDAEDIKGYDFVYFSHASAEKKLTPGGVDMADNAISALEGMFYISAEGDEDTRLRRIIVDSHFYDVYKAPKKESNGSGDVDTQTSMYQFAKELLNISGDVATAKVDNVAVIANGYFAEMDDDKDQAVTDLINRSTYRGYSPESEKYQVLEIQPYYEVKDSAWYKDGEKREQLSATMKDSKDQEVKDAEGVAYYNKDMSAARIAAATGLNVDQLEVKQLSTNALCSTTPNFIEDYDLIYFGANNANVKTKEAWTAYKMLNEGYGGKKYMSFNETDMIAQAKDRSKANANNAYTYPLYSHTGDFVAEDMEFSLFSNPIPGQNGKLNSLYYLRLNGNDITSKVYLKLYDYIEKGMPVVFDHRLIDANYKIGGASANAELVADTYDNNRMKLQDSKKAEEPRYVMKKTTETVNLNTINSGFGGTYNKTTYSRDTMIARRDSSIDPASYMYQLLWHIAEDSSNEKVYRAPNVFVGFDADDVVKTNNLNAYVKGTTSDDDYDKTINASLSAGQETKAGTAETIVSSDSAATSSDKEVKIERIKAFSTKASTILGKLNVSKSGAGIQLRHFLNNYMNVKPTFTLFSKDLEDYDSQRELKEGKESNNPRSPTFKLSVKGNSSHKYTVRLFYDFDGDGKFTVDGDIEQRLEGSPNLNSEIVYEKADYASMEELTIAAGEAGIKSEFVISDEFVGVMPWKLVVTDNTTGRAIEKHGWPKFYPAEKGKNKQRVRLLQIIPGLADSNIGSATHKITTLCAKENTLGNAQNLGATCPMDANGMIQHTFGLQNTEGDLNLAEALEDEYDIQLDIMTTNQFREAVDAYLLEYCRHFDEWSKEDIEAQKDLKDPVIFDQEAADAFKTKFMDVYYKNNQLDSSWKQVTRFLNTEKVDFTQYGITDGFMRTWLMYGPKGRTITLASKVTTAFDDARGTHKGKAQKFSAEGYDMIILGFSQAMGADTNQGGDDSPINDINNSGCVFLRAFINGNGRMLLGTDITSYISIKMTNTQTWSRNINEYLRESFGMDRFKFVTSGVYQDYDKGNLSQPKSVYSTLPIIKDTTNGLNGFLYQPYSTDQYKPVPGSKPDSQTRSGEFFTQNSYDGTYEERNGSSQASLIAGGGATDVLTYVKSTEAQTQFNDVTVTRVNQQTETNISTRVVQNQEGLITNYPYSLDRKNGFLNIAKTNGQSFALDTEDEDMQIWYSLAGDKDNNTSLYAADPLNGRSFYYIYTYKNITYTGAGFDEIVKEGGNNEQERELIINAILCKAKVHRSGPRVVFSENKTLKDSKNSKSVFQPATAGGYATLECQTNDASDCFFDFQVTDEDGAKLSKVYMFFNNGDPTADQREAKEGVEFYDVLLDADGNPVLDKNGKATPYDELIPLEDETYWTVDRKMKIKEKQAFDGAQSNWKEQIKKRMQTGEPFFITVYAEDDKGRYNSARIQIIPKTTLFDLN